MYQKVLLQDCSRYCSSPWYGWIRLILPRHLLVQWITPCLPACRLELATQERTSGETQRILFMFKQSKQRLISVTNLCFLSKFLSTARVAHDLLYESNTSLLFLVAIKCSNSNRITNQAAAGTMRTPLRSYVPCGCPLLRAAMHTSSSAPQPHARW